MINEEQIREGIRALAGKRTPTILGIVSDIDEQNRTCTITDDNVPYYDVRLQCITAGKSGIVVIPADQSQALMLEIEGSGEWALIMCEKVNKVLIDAENEIIINGGDNGGLVKVEKMVEWMQKVYNDLNTLKTQLSTFTVAGNGAPLGMVFNPTTPSPQATTFENDRVKH
ncbi:MAG: hypothetical protein LBT04_03025 [Prevotellaceae bacterium]|jgi:hypothetical protein|nr:hypothetical protein [Prevotellaceae bacterium]